MLVVITTFSDYDAFVSDSYTGENRVFSFIRTVNDIEFPANQINAFVDITNGNVVWYDFSYSDSDVTEFDAITCKPMWDNSDK